MKMKIKTIKIPDAVATILRNQIVCNGKHLQITGERLKPDLYAATNKILVHLGGKWNRKSNSHVFPSDAKVLIDDALGDGKVVNKKQTLQFFETPERIARLMVKHASIKPGMIILEPSAGRGAIVRAINDDGQRASVTVIDIDPAHTPYWESLAIAACKIGDFLAEKPTPVYDRVIMNPPFSGGQDAAHVMHAFKFLKPNGRLVAIVGEGICTRTDKKATAFQAFINDHLTCEEKFSGGEFKESGTTSSSRMIVLDCITSKGGRDD